MNLLQLRLRGKFAGYVTQRKFLDLSSTVSWQCLEHDTLWHLELGKLTFAVFHDLLAEGVSCLNTGLAGHECTRHLQHTLIRVITA